jgi:transposase-like protein
MRRATRRRFSAEKKIRIVLEDLRGEESVAALCRREGTSRRAYFTAARASITLGRRNSWKRVRSVSPVTRPEPSASEVKARSAARPAT